MYKETIIIRVDKEIKKSLKEITKEIPDGISRLMRTLILSYLKKETTNDKIDLKIRQDVKELFNKLKFEKRKKEHKEKLFCYYLINNTLKAIYKLSGSYLINSGELYV